MINKVSFTGRETMLTAGLKNGLKGVEEMPEVIKASSVLPKNKTSENVKALLQNLYTSPFAPTGKSVDNAVNAHLDLMV